MFLGLCKNVMFYESLIRLIKAVLSDFLHALLWFPERFCKKKHTHLFSKNFRK